MRTCHQEAKRYQIRGWMIPLGDSEIWGQEHPTIGRET